MIASMAATVPAGILIWRRYIRNNKTITPGIALHASIFASAIFSFVAVSPSSGIETKRRLKLQFAIDKALEARLRDQTKYPVEQG
jgi:hypothetical protein